MGKAAKRKSGNPNTRGKGGKGACKQAAAAAPAWVASLQAAAAGSSKVSGKRENRQRRETEGM